MISTCNYCPSNCKLFGLVCLIHCAYSWVFLLLGHNLGMDQDSSDSDIVISAVTADFTYEPMIYNDTMGILFHQ